MRAIHREKHRHDRIGWLRAAVLGANDGIISTASLILGVAAAHSDRHTILITGVAGLVAGAMSMAAGEYVSVHSQADTESAELEREKAELANDDEAEHAELANIYQSRGLSPELARQVARELMAHNALEAHMRDELGMTEASSARPIQAAFASAASFTAGAALPLVIAVLSPAARTIWLTAAGSLLCLAGLGGLAANIGGAPVLKGCIRVTFWGAFAMAVTSGIGMLFGTSV